MTDDRTKILPTSDSTLRMNSENSQEKNNLNPSKVIPGLEFNGYMIQSRLSIHTGEAEIYLVKKNNIKYILKYYYPNFSPKYEVLEKLKGINHPDIINLYEYGREEGRFFEILDFAEGGSLADKNENGDYKYLPMTEKTVLQILKETINAFHYFHEKGIIHRDIKPGNLFYKNSEGTDLLVGDFGISSELDLEGDMSKRITTTSRTEGYAAPEVYSGLIGKEVDYYALGITVFELLTAKHPFLGRNDLHIMRDTIQGRIIEDFFSRSEAKNFSEKIKKLLRGLLTVKHEKRWGYSEVNKFLSGEDVSIHEEKKYEIPSLIIGNREYYSLRDISSAIQENHNNVKKMLYRGMLSRWAEGFDKNLALQIGDIEEEFSASGDQDFGLEILKYTFDPELSYSNKNGVKINNLHELKIELEKKSDFYADMINVRSDFHAFLKSRGLENLSHLIKECLKKNLSRNKFYSYLLLSFNTNFQTSIDPKITLNTVEDILKYPETIRYTILKWLYDPESYISVWLEFYKDKKFYHVWFSGKITQDYEHLIALLNNRLFFYNNYYLTESEKADVIRIEEEKKNYQIQMNEKVKNLEILSQKIHPKRVSLFEIQFSVSFSLLFIICGYFIYNSMSNLALISVVLYLIYLMILFHNKIEYIKKINNNSKNPGSNSLFTWKESNEKIIQLGYDYKMPSIDELREIYILLQYITKFNKNWDGANQCFWSSTDAGYDTYYCINFTTGEIFNLHKARKINLLAIPK